MSTKSRSSSKKSAKKSADIISDDDLKKLSPAKRKGPNIIYITVSVTIILLGVVFIILAQTLDNATFLFIALGLLGLGVMLIVQRSVFKQSSSTAESQSKEKTKEEDDDDSLKMRTRR